MREFFLSLRIRFKLVAAFGSILLLSVLLIIFSIASINNIIAYKTINEEVDALKLHFETLDLTVKDFMYEGYKSKSFLDGDRCTSIDLFSESYTHSKKIIATIDQSNLHGDEETAALTQSLIITIDNIKTEFGLLVELLKKRGFKDYGSEGSLRQAIHEVENSEFAFDKTAMLTLRRHEKDFFLRKDLKYKHEFNEQLIAFRQQLESVAPAELLKYLDNYQTEFNKVVDIEKQIGLKEDEGIRGRIKEHFTSIRPKIEAYSLQIKERNEQHITRTKIVLGIIFSFQIIAGLIMAIVYANLLTKAIKEIRSAMQKLAAGIFPDNLVVRSTEEIGETKQAFNQFVNRLRAATTFAEHLGSGELNARYDEHFADDVLAKSLMVAQEKLRHSDERQSKINWVNQGAAQFNDILKNESEEIAVLSDNILKLLVKYIHANQGALYLVKRTGNEEFLERTATYAYEKKKFDAELLDTGVGLIGQCVQEQSTIYLKEVPKGYVKITSGLGEATPRNILIVPMKIRAHVMGVLELASFHVFETYQIEFIERIAENIAMILSNKQTASETKRLLDESQHRASTLLEQEEEMRQNTEELEATQEEMERQREAMQLEIRQLKKKLSSLSEVAMAE